MVNHICKTCTKVFEKKSHFVQHLMKKNPCKPSNIIIDTNPKNDNVDNPSKNNNENICNINKNTIEDKIYKPNYKCNYCNREFKRSDYLRTHLISRCKIRKEENKEKEEIFKRLLEKMEKLEEQNKEMNKLFLEKNEEKDKKIKLLEIENNHCKNYFKNNKEVYSKIQKDIITIKNKININDITSEISKTNPINEQLIDIIVKKDKHIDELKTNKNNLITIIDNNKPKKEINNELNTLTLNDIVIISRTEDNYINATQLCQAGDKKFNDWFRLDTTKQLISILEAEAGNPVSGLINTLVTDMGIPISALIDIKKGGNNKHNQGSWIHPDLAIQLAQWISPTKAGC